MGEQNLDEARRWYRRCSKDLQIEISKRMESIADNYYYGKEGVAKDVSTALGYYQLCNTESAFIKIGCIYC